MLNLLSDSLQKSMPNFCIFSWRENDVFFLYFISLAVTTFIAMLTDVSSTTSNMSRGRGSGSLDKVVDCLKCACDMENIQFSTLCQSLTPGVEAV